MSNVTAGAEIIGLDALIGKLDSISDASIETALNRACIIVENSAKDNCPVETGILRNSIQHQVEGNEGIVYTTMPYGVWVEYGTGAFATHGDGRPGYWVFVKGSGAGEGSGNPRKYYTLAEAKQAMAILRKKGLEAYYTNGQHPQPFMEPALNDNRDRILEEFKKTILKENE